MEKPTRARKRKPDTAKVNLKPSPCKSPEGRVSTVRGIRRACGEVPGRSRWGNPRRTGRLVSRSATCACCTEDEGRSFGVVLQEKAPNSHELLQSKAVVVNVMEKGVA